MGSRVCSSVMLDSWRQAIRNKAGKKCVNNRRPVQKRKVGHWRSRECTPCAPEKWPSRPARSEIAIGSEVERQDRAVRVFALRVILNAEAPPRAGGNALMISFEDRERKDHQCESYGIG